LEYALIVAVVVAGLIAMQYYMKRGVQGKLRESTDQIGEQYSAGNVTSTFTTEQTGPIKTKETFGLSDVDGKTPAQGVSYYKVVAPAEVKRSATGTKAEKVVKDLKDEKLYP
jgi:Flp pilus assembly pilin Flp